MPHLIAPPLNVEDIIHLRSVEHARLEFKAVCDDTNRDQVVKTISAFANDLQNLNGGYVVIGIEEQDGIAVLPPRGIPEDRLDLLQKEIRGDCKRLLTPEYQPLFYPVMFEGKYLLIIYAPGGDNRPYSTQNRNQKQAYFVRIGSQTAEAQDDIHRQLIEQTARIPFDDRRNLSSRIEDISSILVRRFLADVRSDLASTGQQVDDLLLYDQLRLLAPVNGHKVPKNVALMFFNENPDTFFPGSRIEVVQFGDGAGGDLIEERTFKGPLPLQIKSTLDYLDSLGGRLLQKTSKQAEVERTVAYPYAAMEEALVNAVYHRSYDNEPEPIKVYLYPDRLEIISYPGPVQGISAEHFLSGRTLPPVPARNRRIGELLKELRLCESRGTGIPKIKRKMEENGSPPPAFDFDEPRSFFRVSLPVHPRYQVIHALREVAHLWATGAKDQAIASLARAKASQPGSGALVGQFIEYCVAANDTERALGALDEFEKQKSRTEVQLPYLTLARLLLDRQQIEQARGVLKRLPPSSNYLDLVEAALLRKRSEDYEDAHRLFAQAIALRRDDSKLLHEFAQTKMKLTSRYRSTRNPQGREVRQRLNREAEELLRTALQSSDSNIRSAWCWFDLAKVSEWLQRPVGDIHAAYQKAIELLPSEHRFEKAYRRWKSGS
ncbi:ATP-dependent DNA helicase RecG [Prosthecobacter fusiformis]|uniref:ATP-dependent DNA helicase RecG n=1 Tax=Prosthecobacter fusiformis TaxID=48464 RepID=A0A4R7S481_9BACT|nr:RNA-binding domain-containing protein [Prosthecobacter fusiformis]TDU73151.1 ATP-dependent DNA helicase RecG [Prosthecobacter fusiformis]